ncbi:hypothetical protein CISG_05357 [Coccidioides immitis RMSCC 3703]|uniref:Uncharacterized protein n=1 Tax=Coccidioides immitis RMSCC 3703 TaxID=454286 RepID=A0A0J8QVM9_COCIT|nr:hypothetical protein CISG_05357 [Coccidioides immitis RMSCC 3703]
MSMLHPTWTLGTIQKDLLCVVDVDAPVAPLVLVLPAPATANKSCRRRRDHILSIPPTGVDYYSTRILKSNIRGLRVSLWPPNTECTRNRPMSKPNAS